MKIYLNLFLRKFLKSATLNVLNLFGLALGIIAALLVVVYADHEFHFDQFHDDADQIFRMEGKTNGDRWFSNLGVEHARELVSESYPEVVERVMINTRRSTFIVVNDVRYAEKHIYQTNPGSKFFNLFDFEVLEGKEEIFLEEPHVVVLTASTAEKYFGTESAVGKVVVIDSISHTVTGVIKDIRTDTHFDFDLIYTNPDAYGDGHYHTQTYLQLVNSVDIGDLEEKILDLPGYDEFHNLSAVRLINVGDIHLKSNASFGRGGKGDEQQIWVFLVIGCLILFISISNYVNLSFAIYLSKGREVGIRKVFGESRYQIIIAFIYESLASVALVIPLVLIGFGMLLPLFSIYLDVNLINPFYQSPTYILGGLGLIVFISLVATIFPALSLSGTNTNYLLKSKSAMNILGGVGYRNGLIFFQFILLFTLGISGWLMNQQVNYLDNKDMGFEAEGVIKVENAFDIGSVQDYELFKTKLLSYPQISSVSFGPMIGDGMSPLAYKPEGSDQIYENLLSYGVDIDYFDVMNIELTHGDFKSVLRSSDNGQVTSLVNESFTKSFGWLDEPLGKKIILRPGTENELNRKVSGVFKDFHFFTLKEKITPQIISLRPDPQFVNTNILIRTNGNDVQDAVKIIEEQWYEIQPELPMEYVMMEDVIKRLYEKDKQTGRISMTFSILAIGLSVFGLIGFMIYIIGLKSKELTVRKVLGASMIQLIMLLNRQMFVIVIFAAVFGGALSYLFKSNWLEDYAYAISINPIIFPVAITLVYIIIFLITAVRSLKWAASNPVLSLSEE